MLYLVDFEKHNFEKELLFQLSKTFENSNSFMNWLKSIKNLSIEKIEKILSNVLKTNKTLIPAVITFLISTTPIIDLSNVISTFAEKDQIVLLNEIDKEVEKKDFSFDESKFLNKLSHRESSNNWKVVNQYGYIGKYQIGYIALLDVSKDLELSYFKNLKGTKKEKIKKLLNDFIENSNALKNTQHINAKKIAIIKKSINIKNSEKESKINDILENEKIFKKKTIAKLTSIFSEKEQNETIKKIIKNNEYYLRRYKKYIGAVIDSTNITWTGMLAAAHLKGATSVKEFINTNGKSNPKDANGASVKFYLTHFEKLN
jgi:hypothetical protein